MIVTEPINIHEAAQEIAQRALDEIEYAGHTLREWIEAIKDFPNHSPELRRQYIADQIEVLNQEEIQARAAFENATKHIRRKREILYKLWNATYQDGDPHDSGQEERCLATGLMCSRCTPGPCDHRRTAIADDSGQ